MKVRSIGGVLLLLCLISLPCAAQSSAREKEVDLPSSKLLLLPAPGGPQPTNSFPTAVALSPDGKYLAILNNGYGTEGSKFQQSIALLDLASNRLRDFPDPRLALHAKQSYFLGLAWSSDGASLYASIASLTEPDGKNPGDTGNGVAVYRLQNGTLLAERFLKLPGTPLGHGKQFTYNPRSVAPGYANPYPAGLAVVKRDRGDALLIVENLADDAVLLDARSGKVLQRFDLSRGKYVPAAFPYGVVVSADGSRGWCSLWNASQVAELDLRSGKVVRQVALMPPQRDIDALSHPTALLLSPDERQLYVTLANRDRVAVIATSDGKVEGYLRTLIPFTAPGTMGRYIRRIRPMLQVPSNQPSLISRLQMPRTPTCSMPSYGGRPRAGSRCPHLATPCFLREVKASQKNKEGAIAPACTCAISLLPPGINR